VPSSRCLNSVGNGLSSIEGLDRPIPVRSEFRFDLNAAVRAVTGAPPGLIWRTVTMLEESDRRDLRRRYAAGSLTVEQALAVISQSMGRDAISYFQEQVVEFAQIEETSSSSMTSRINIKTGTGR
jgi:hypothetical protein